VLVFLAVLLGCPATNGPADPTSWYDPGEDLDVVEPIAFTDEPYDFGASDGIGAFDDAIFPVDGSDTLFAEGDAYEDGSCDAAETPDLPREIEGVATIYPRFYMKVDGCDRDTEEKYYGSFFLEDASGAVFVLGDSKLAQFEAGNKVKIRVRAVRSAFDFDMVYSWDLVDVDRSVTPIHYEVPVGPLGSDDHSHVMRVSGVVTTGTDTFGAFQIESDDGTTYDIQVDQELGRRGVAWEKGTRIQVTGPVLYSYSIRAILVMSLGQVTVLGTD
jgi:hypothetical protein